MLLTSEDAAPLLVEVLFYKYGQLIDDRDGVDVAVALRLTPGKQPVSAQNDSVTVGLIFDGFAEHYSEFESRTLPGKPDQLVIVESIELLHFFEPVGCCGKSNRAVRVEMVHMSEGKEPVQRCIDRCHDGIQ